MRWLVFLVAGCLVPLSASGCSGTYPARDPVGETFPVVVGQSLEQARVELPSDLLGAPAVLLIGYQQQAQFDLDRWLMGLLQAGVRGQVIEVPTIPALVPTLLSGWIDEGMRGGIPEEDWGAVVTLYGAAAEPVAALTGTERGQVARIVILDAEGRILWFDDNGYSARRALEAATVLQELEAPAQATR